MSLDRAAESLVAALALIDRLGEFFQVEHAWLIDGEWSELTWEAKVNTVVDHHGYVLPEMYEALVHLAHALRDLLDEVSKGTS